MYIPDESKGELMELIQEYRSNHPKHSNQSKPIKITDSHPSRMRWTAVTVGKSGEADNTKINIPGINAQSGGLHIKAGGIEFEADENFPTENLIVLLRGLGAEGVC